MAAQGHGQLSQQKNQKCDLQLCPQIELSEVAPVPFTSGAVLALFHPITSLIEEEKNSSLPHRVTLFVSMAVPSSRLFIPTANPKEFAFSSALKKSAQNLLLQPSHVGRVGAVLSLFHPMPSLTGHTKLSSLAHRGALFCFSGSPNSRLFIPT